jgi:hypothetical protein
MHSLLLVVSLIASAAAATDGAACPPKGMTHAELFAFKAEGFGAVSDAKANALAVDLLGCLGDADPKIRDGIVFEAIQFWLRNNKLQVETAQTIYGRLLEDLNGPEDTGGYLRPFAALLLSEVVRADRVAPFMNAAQRTSLAKSAAAFMRGVTDYRGFDEVQGWRHRVAHSADLIMQLALNPQVGKPDLKQLMQAVFAQVSPKGAVFYIYGEPERLSRAVYFAHRRGLLSHSEWAELFDRAADPAPFASWGDIYSSQAGLAKHHDTVEFLNEIYTSAKASNDAQGEELAAFALGALRALDK